MSNSGSLGRRWKTGANERRMNDAREVSDGPVLHVRREPVANERERGKAKSQTGAGMSHVNERHLVWRAGECHPWLM